MEPFIHNHQFNFIQQQIYTLQYSVNSVVDQEVLEIVRLNTEEKILHLFSNITKEQQQLLSSFKDLKREHEFYEYLESLLPYRVMFPYVTEQHLKGLFKKTKKLQTPALADINFKSITFLAWNDSNVQKKYFVFPYNGIVRGIQATITPMQQKNICSLCKQFTKVGMVTAETNNRFESSYRAIGNYMCLDSYECNRNITDREPIEAFFEDVLGN
ncbi:FusB/FusC family EF-G-binding protein [Pontibacillus yanchengensis]|uniref:Fibronectin-binding protein n=1 Tax=Pontibacillus yanchengensis Y32 TaxID=1385514 RepID=A0A0A2TC38_9BACI|nr:elongation factor G-binding protein [Pontibacillus yanchengensis]KGP73347.1 fibronectin-binding protein [Pontibacillus yanchengensis Y32]